MIKKLIAVSLAIAVLLAALSFAAAAEDVVFTVQPQSAKTTTGKTVTITWETNIPCEDFMLQSRDSAKYDWANNDYITSPYTTMEYNNPFYQEYCIAANINSDNPVYSDVFTLEWALPENMTEVEMSSVDITDLPLGYTERPVYPISVKNVGEYEVIDPTLAVFEPSDFCEIIENKKPHNIKPGETDDTTWSVRPKAGLGIGEYLSYVYIISENVSTGTSANVLFTVVESDVKITYAMASDGVDFGTLEYGYGEQPSFDIVVRSTGTGNLHNVHLVRGDADTSFFDIQTNNGTIVSLNAGTDSGYNWSARLRRGLEPGDYSTQIKVYCDELDDPITVTLKARITGDVTSSETEVLPSSDVSPQTAAGLTGLIIAAIIIGLLLLAAVVVLIVMVLLKKKK